MRKPADSNETRAETKTHFGFQEIPVDEKNQRVAEVFHTVASQYDLMNDLMSFGLHRYWKRTTLARARVRPGQRILDIAGGTGDLTRGFANQTGKMGRVYLADINSSMLEMGRAKLTDNGLCGNIFYVQANAEILPFVDDYFDIVSIAFGLRNVTHQARALAAMHRVLKPGGKLLVLEFSKPMLPFLKPVYDSYSFRILPKLGKLITGSAESYQYLVESIRKHPDQETLRQMILDAGFESCQYANLSGGIVCLHTAHK